MAQKTEAEKAEDARRAALSPEARAEEDRRADLTPEERDQEDMDELNEQIAAEEAAKIGGEGAATLSARQQKAALERRMIASAKTTRAKEATVEAKVARGRTIFTEAGQTEPHREGDVIMLTPAEHAKLVSLGAVVAPDGNIEEPEGPKVYREAGLLVGHAKGQGQTAANK